MILCCGEVGNLGFCHGFCPAVYLLLSNPRASIKLSEGLRGRVEYLPRFSVVLSISNLPKELAYEDRSALRGTSRGGFAGVLAWLLIMADLPAVTPGIPGILEIFTTGIPVVWRYSALFFDLNIRFWRFWNIPP
jgi:hypothetical protein